MIERTASELYQLFCRGFRDEAQGNYPRDVTHGSEPAYRIGRECSRERSKSHTFVPMDEAVASKMFAELVGHETNENGEG
jgi:hypothetical protein